MTIGLVGCGKMGSALIQGAIKAGVFQATQVIAYDPLPAAIASLGAEITPAESLDDLISKSDILLLCVKPHDVPTVLSKISTSDLLVISIAAGVTLSAMEESCQGQARLIRAMPNTPALVGEGAGAFAPGPNATSDDSEFAKKLLGSIGIVYEVKEALLDTVTGISGSGPAYVYTFIEALADGALLEGLPRDQALALATQTVLGAARMVSDSNLHPAVLRDQVTSPGGTTIAGLAALEKGAFRATVIDAVKSATARARELGS